SQVHLPPQVPDYVKLAEAYGAVGLRATDASDVDSVIDKALGVTDRPCVIDFRVDPSEKCFPMIPAGASNDDIMLGPEPSDRAVRRVRSAAVKAEEYSA
ncbi:MAG TPA: thiamine pyrophosphate-dependent enzyme, partial [Actinomycetota bacterium]|nr:thiamine pyrophosphate-dependent enzyme [Actinomycetota bacterium]